MQKPKRKIRQQNFWQKFYDNYVHFQRDFRYEIDRKPQNLLETLEIYLRKQGSTWELNERTKDELWDLELSSWEYVGRYGLGKEIIAKLLAKIYLENEKTMITGSISSDENSWIFVLSTSLFFAFLALVLEIVLHTPNYQMCLAYAFFSSIFFTMEVASRINKIKKAKELHELLETFVTIEEEKLKAESKQHHGKGKNEDVSAEILKDKRK
jgi:hypothetical protein